MIGVQSWWNMYVYFASEADKVKEKDRNVPTMTQLDIIRSSTVVIRLILRTKSDTDQMT